MNAIGVRDGSSSETVCGTKGGLDCDGSGVD